MNKTAYLASFYITDKKSYCGLCLQPEKNCISLTVQDSKYNNKLEFISNVFRSYLIIQAYLQNDDELLNAASQKIVYSLYECKCELNIPLDKFNKIPKHIKTDYNIVRFLSNSIIEKELHKKVIYLYQAIRLLSSNESSVLDFLSINIEKKHAKRFLDIVRSFRQDIDDITERGEEPCNELCDSKLIENIIDVCVNVYSNREFGYY